MPQFEMAAGDSPRAAAGEETEEEEEEDEEDNLFGAAYEGVSYRDTTDDGVEGEMFEVGPSDSEFELVREAERIIDRIGFLITLAAIVEDHRHGLGGQGRGRSRGGFTGWLTQASAYHQQLLQLLASIQGYRIPSPRGTQDAGGIRSPPRRERNAARGNHRRLRGDGRRGAHDPRRMHVRRPQAAGLAAWERLAGDAFAAVFRGDAPACASALPALLRELRKQPLLYVALVRGGKPQRIAASRGLQYVLRRLLAYLPRLGLLTETCRLLETAQKMETEHPAGSGRDHGV